jgi:hypothetical protein
VRARGYNMARPKSRYGRGEHPNSRANLRKFGTLTEKEQHKLSVKGGKVSGEVRRNGFKQLNYKQAIELIRASET